MKFIYNYVQQYSPFETCIELLESTATDEDKKPLTEDIIEDKVVMLLLEVPLIDEKNCVAGDCADKGKRLEFKVRALLIDREDLLRSDLNTTLCLSKYFHPLPYAKYNTPGTGLVTGQQVLDAYNTQVLTNMQVISDGVIKVHDHYSHELYLSFSLKR